MSLLRPLEWSYRQISALRRWAYERELLRSRSLPRPVISIGNLAMGGTGKTPATIAIAEVLRSAGLRVAILTRGYARRGSDRVAIVESADARRYGDEPVLLRESLPGVDVVVGADRFEAGTWYLSARDCDVFLLDDGFQHLRLRRDFDLVIDHRPASPLRESRRALRHADAILLRNGAARPEASPPIFSAELEPASVRSAGTQLPPDSLRGRRLVAFSALADNRQFFELLRRLGVEMVAQEGYPDHHHYTEADRRRLRALRESTGGEQWITTAKDAVKLPDLDPLVLEVRMRIEPLAPLRTLLLAAIGGTRDAAKASGGFHSSREAGP